MLHSSGIVRAHPVNRAEVIADSVNSRILDMQLLLVLLLGALSYSMAYTRSYSYDYPRRRPSPYSYNTIPAQRNLQSRQSTGTAAATKSDTVNAKFAGAGNQELDESLGDERTLLLKKKLRKLARPYLGYGGYGGYGGGYGGYGGGNPCSPFGRDAKSVQKDSEEQGRFLFDVNVYKVYQGGCRGYGGGGGGLGGGLLSDPIPQPYPVPVPVRPYAPFATWLSLFAPGLLGAAPVPGVPLSDPIRPATAAGDLQSDPEVDPSYAAPPVRRPVPNRIYYDSAGAPPVTPAQLLGGVATTVNGIIQQLTGQVQPVYQTGAYRSRDLRSSSSSYRSRDLRSSSSYG